MIKIGTNTNIQKLWAYGGCQQNGTPSPSTPVDILCNNGKIQVVDDELPDGYVRVERINFDGDFYYDTGKTLFGSDDVTLTLDNTYTKGQNVFGSYNGTTGKANYSLYIYGDNSTSQCYLRYGTQLLRPRYGSDPRTLVFGASGVRGFATSVTLTPDEFETEAPAYIGMLPNSSSSAYTGDIVGNILVSDRLKYIPCERVSDGEIGYYEAINGEFITKSGKGTPVSGAYDTSHLSTVIYGTNEQIITGGLISDVENLFAVGDYVDQQELTSGTVLRKCGVKVFTGTENWTLIDGSGAYTLIDDINPNTISELRCTHYQTSSAGELQDGYMCVTTNRDGFTFCDTTNCQSVETWTNYLANQYANGTPVIVVYPVSTPISEQVDAQSVSGSVATISQSSIGGLIIKTQCFNDLLKRYVVDNNGSAREVVRVYIGGSLIWEV